MGSLGLGNGSLRMDDVYLEGATPEGPAVVGHLSVIVDTGGSPFSGPSRESGAPSDGIARLPSNSAAPPPCPVASRSRPWSSRWTVVRCGSSCPPGTGRSGRSVPSGPTAWSKSSQSRSSRSKSSPSKRSQCRGRGGRGRSRRIPAEPPAPVADVEPPAPVIAQPPAPLTWIRRPRPPGWSTTRSR